MNITDQQRHQPGTERLILSNEIHVWRAYLDLNAFQIETMLKTLSPDEVERAERFRLEKDKKRFIAARGVLRNILGNYIGLTPERIMFEYDPNGKPVLSTIHDSKPIRFNLSHSGAFALYAIALHRNVGIDIELIRNDIDVIQIARRFFSENEFASFKQADRDKLHEVFFQYWTRKEAILKACGKGVIFPMEKIDVSLINTTLSPITLPGDDGSLKHWYVRDLHLYPNYKAAVASEERDHDLIYIDYSI